jgi:hypothetical protein
MFYEEHGIIANGGRGTDDELNIPKYHIVTYNLHFLHSKSHVHFEGKVHKHGHLTHLW